MKNKFKVRVRYYHKGYYIVEYAHFWLIPTWHPLLYWFELGHPRTGHECWAKNFFTREVAEKIAYKLTSIKEVDRYNELHLRHYNKWLEDEAEYVKTNGLPYTVKYFK